MVLSFSGCGKLKELDQKLGEVFFDDKVSGSEESLLDKIKDIEISTSKEKAQTDSPVEEITAENLTKEQKDKIEKWLEEQGLNRYGDAIGTYYEKGTPLIDEAGKTIERFEYILDKHQEISEIFIN